VWLAAADYVHDSSQPVPLIVPDEPSRYRATALAALDARQIPWRIRHVSTSLAFGGLRAALRAGLGVTVRVPLRPWDHASCGEREACGPSPRST
jgi:hypothetical protein